MLRECGVGWTDVERVCNDRFERKKSVSERMRYLDKQKCTATLVHSSIFARKNSASTNFYEVDLKFFDHLR